MKTKAVVLDLDGTLCELKPESEQHNHTWNEKPIDFMYHVYLGMVAFKLIILTGRKEKYREITEKWLYDQDIMFDELIMQEKSQADKNHVFKREKLIELQERYEIVAMVDDNPMIIPICKELWILLLHVNR